MKTEPTTKVFRLVEEKQETGGGDFLSQLPDVLDKRQLASLLGVTTKTLEREVERGRLRCIHVGRRVRFTKLQVIEYLEAAVND